MYIVIFVLLAWFLFCFLLLLWPASASRNHLPHTLGRIEDRSGLSGVREPRRPRPPHWPPRAAAVVPEDTESQLTDLTGYSNTPQHSLRLKDGLA
jgi:hypothetical protein